MASPSDGERVGHERPRSSRPRRRRYERDAAGDRDAYLPADWRDGRTARQNNDAGLVEEIGRRIAHLPSWGYRRVWSKLRNERENNGRRENEGTAPVNVKRVCSDGSTQ
jgi:hypothetical protein